jgi:hypothetical protein
VGGRLPVLTSAGYDAIAYRLRARLPVRWRRDHGRFTFWIELPPSVVASVRIPSDDPAAVRDQAGAGPVSVAGYRGALGAAEAVFTVGSGSHEFAGPALTS